MRWAKLLSKLSQNVNEELLKQNELLKAQVLELQQHQQGQIRDTEFFKRHMARLTKGLSNTALEAACLVVRPSTVLRWHRELIAKKFDGSKNRSYPGRPRIGSAMESLIVAMAEDNCWGALRIQGALKHIGHTVSHQTLLSVLKKHGLQPSPYRLPHARSNYCLRLRYLLHTILHKARYTTCSRCRYYAIPKSELDAAGCAEFNRS